MKIRYKENICAISSTFVATGRSNLADNLFTVENFLTPEECQRVIEQGERMGFEAAMVAMSSGAKMMPMVRNNDRSTFEDPALTGLLWERVLRTDVIYRDLAQAKRG